MILTLLLAKNGSVKQKSSIMHELSIALTSFLGDSCTNGYVSSIMHGIPLVLLWNGSV